MIACIGSIIELNCPDRNFFYVTKIKKPSSEGKELISFCRFCSSHYLLFSSRCFVDGLLLVTLNPLIVSVAVDRKLTWPLLILNNKESVQASRLLKRTLLTSINVLVLLILNKPNYFLAANELGVFFSNIESKTVEAKILYYVSCFLMYCKRTVLI